MIQEYLTVARKNHNMAEEENEIVMDCVKTINTNVPCSFLVGGASMVQTFPVGMDELVYSVYLSSELIVIDTQTVDGPDVL